MAYAHVQSTQQNTLGGTSINIAFGSNVTAGNLLVVGFGFHDTGNTITVSDSRTNSYTQARSHNDPVNGNTVRIYRTIANSSGANTVTVSMSGGGGSDVMLMAIHEFSGNATTSELGAVNSANGNSAAPDSGNVATTLGESLIFGAMMSDNNSHTKGADFTLGQTVVNRMSTEYRFFDGTDSANFTIVSTGWAMVVAVFNPPPSGPPPASHTMGIRIFNTVP